CAVGPGRPRARVAPRHARLARGVRPGEARRAAGAFSRRPRGSAGGRRPPHRTGRRDPLVARDDRRRRTHDPRLAPPDERNAGARAGVTGAPGSSLVLRFLDDLRAAEAAGAAVVDAWVAVCPLPSLRGGLRTIAEREAGHAVLLEERLRELGGACHAAVSETMRAAALARFGSPAVSDEEKLALVVA